MMHGTINIKNAVHTFFAINLKKKRFHCGLNNDAKDSRCERATLPVTHKIFSVLCQGLVIFFFFGLYQHCLESY